MNKLAQFVKKLPEDLDAALISSDCNRLYYTGMESSAGTLFVTREQCYFIIDFRYIEVARRKVQDCEVILQEKLGEQLRELAQKHHVRRVGIESENCSLKTFLSYREMLPDCEIAMDNALTELIAAQRMIKDEAELDWIRRAQDLTDRSFEYICGFIKPGQTEREIALELEFYSRKLGSECASFDFIVVSGPNSSLPHGVPGERTVRKGDFITMDFGCVVGGYHSDMTRTVALGEPDSEMKKVYETVLRANRTSMAAVRAGAECAQIDRIARDIIEVEAGYQGCFGHSLGHSVGVQIHEAPGFASSCKTLCQPGMIMTIEPGIYLEGRFGCRIEDMIVITENGCVNLTKSNKELIIL